MTAARPEWLKIKPPDAAAMQRLKQLLDGMKLNTVCESAQCPNAGECFGSRTATFMIMGRVCTRSCTFCAVQHGQTERLDAGEPERVAAAAAGLGLRHVVITSVTRDDLPDGGAAHFAAVIRAVRRKLPQASVEVLISDLAGDAAAIGTIAAAGPDVLSHNIETVPALYQAVRPQADYRRSIHLFRQVRQLAPGLVTKSGLMLGLGETVSGVTAVLQDLRAAGCDMLTLGQYLRPSAAHIAMTRYITPQEFDGYRCLALAAGFKAVVASPLVRSSYHAREAYREAVSNLSKTIGG